MPEVRTKTPEQLLELISDESVRNTPLELIRNAMMQHFEEDRQIHEIVQRLDARLDAESDAYVLKPLLPYMQGAAGLGIVWKGLVAIGGLILMWVQIKQMLGK